VACGIRYGEFARNRNIRDFLIDADERADPPFDLAAHALESLTVGDKRRMDFATCVAVVAFLDEWVGAPHEDREDRQRLKDLARLVAQASPFAQYKLWATTWYD